MSDAKPYGSVNMKMYECVGHVQKRMRARLIDMMKKRHVHATGQVIKVSGKDRITAVPILKASAIL